MNFKINNKTGSPIEYEKEIHSLCDFAQQRLGFEESPSIFLNHDKRNASNTLGKTGYYDPDTMEIHVFATNRHPKDILRSIAHELVHHNQNERGELKDSGYMGKGYAQKNPHMRKMELQANDPMLFRDWEDSLKEKENTIYNERRNRKMSLKEWKNKEIGDLLTGKWGFKMNLGKLSESQGDKEKEEETGPEDKPEGDEEEKGPEAPKEKFTRKGTEKKSMKENEGPGQDEEEPETPTDEPEGEGEGEDPKDPDKEPPSKKPKKKGKKEMPQGLKDYIAKRKKAKKQSLEENKLADGIMRRVAKRIMRMKKGKK